MRKLDFMVRGALMAALAFGASGCFVFDYGARPSDGGMTGQDANNPRRDSGGGIAVLDNTCGAPTPHLILTQTTRNIQVDTNTLTNAVTSSCGGASTVGNDAFIAVDIQAGVYWHFHLRNDPDDPASAAREPALYMLRSTCDARECTFSSDVCTQFQDEHFGFVADQNGRWYLGIDDRMAGGGRYLLDAIRPVCGDDMQEHGEACDDGNVEDGDGCSHRCLRELTVGSPGEREPNDNPTEANFIVMPPSGEFTVDGNIGGPGNCRYADTFAVDVPPGARVEVDVLDGTGAICGDSTLTEGYGLALRDASFTDVTTGEVDPATSCAWIRSPALSSGGVYYVSVILPDELDRAVPYHLLVRVTL